MSHLNSNDLPNGFILMLANNCSLGGKNKVLSTHRTLADAGKAAHDLNHVKTDLLIKDIYSGTVYSGVQ